MRLFRDVFTQDELLSDSFPVKEVEDGLIIEATAKRITLEANDYGISSNDEDGAGLGDEAQTVINIVDAFRLVETNFDKKGFMTMIKAYMKKVKAYLEAEAPDRVEPFTKKAPVVIKKILSNFDEYQFFMSESCEPTAHITLMFYGDDGITPKLWFFKDGLKEEKV